MTPDDILRFWFDTTPQAPSERAQQRWWTKDPAFDAELRERFMETWEQARSGALDHWAQSPSGRLALILVLDQFSRNMHRGSPLSWTQDPAAQALCLAALAAEDDKALPKHGRLFLYMPLEHAEDVALQERSMDCFRALVADYPEEQMLLDYADRHAEIVRRFGRFPHRNSVIGRESTPEELSFLQEPNSSF